MDRMLTIPTRALQAIANAQARLVSQVERARNLPRSANLVVNPGAISALTRVGLASPPTYTTLASISLDPGRWLLYGSARHTATAVPTPQYDFSLAVFAPSGNTQIRVPSFVDTITTGRQFALTVTLVVNEPAAFTATLRAGLNANDTGVQATAFDASLLAIPG